MLNVDNIYLGDALDLFEQLPDNSIDLVVTSPPYFLEKSYEKNWTKKKYEDLLVSTFIGVNRVLKPGRYFVVNFGDYFNSGNRFYEADVPSCYPASINYFRWGVEVAGMDLQATRIWRKQFAKMGIPFVCNSHPRPIFDYEHIWTFRKKNGDSKEFVNDRKLSQRGVLGEGWTSLAKLSQHCAAFPFELPEWAINVYSQPGDLVLDPFIGSGTTALAARYLGRKYIGFEKSEEYVMLAKKRLSEDSE